ncbi:hypothetical protein SAMN06265349_10463 [Flavobacterium resistens]|uniref:Uncharacterized protein n=1 Tax=Flavobacterium resistens TaxID=443612 RepID=A0A521E5B2_9FLAO|nr:hypothetical protein [Flavobacterium resistens]MRX69250.1 hypothetical protein [Flavobacterium resistens]SMO78561.1 hypothetical protein SAMN06265349_10463 [Flavobacterium resistens]
MNTEILLDKPEERTNYFYNFNFSKFKTILYPLAIVAFLFIIKQFIINNFHIPGMPGMMGLLGAFDSFNSAKELPIWAEIINRFIDILILVIMLCWEAVYEKKYDKIKFILLICLPSIVLNTLHFYTNLGKSETSESILSIFFIINFFPTYALYGALRGKILYGKKLSLIGYFIGLICIVSISTIYQKIGSSILVNDFYISIYSYGSALVKVFSPLSFFYFLFLSDAGFSFKNFIKMPSVSLLSNKSFTIHFTILFTSLLALHLNFTENFSEHWFGDLNSRLSIIVYSIFEFLSIILQIAFVYLLFSQLLLLQLTALRRRPLWIYLFSFIPVINLIPLVFFFRKSIPLTNTEYFEMEDNEQRNRSLLQFFILFLASVYGIYKFIGLGLSRENLIYLILTFISLYILILYIRIGVWIAFTLLSIATIFFLFQDMPTSLYYTCVLFYGGIGLYNLHIALFWKAKEWDEIDENIVTQNTEEV